MMSEVNTSNGQLGILPSLTGNLPQWSRINTLDKGRPRHLLKDSQETIQSPASSISVITNHAMTATDTHVIHLEKNISFLRKQHKDVLTSLHSEIEFLKRNNKDLQFRLVMLNKPTPPIGEKQELITAAPPINIMESGGAVQDSVKQCLVNVEVDAKYKKLEQELSEVKLCLTDEKSKNHFLSSLIEKNSNQEVLSCSTKSPLPEIERKNSSKNKTLPFKTTLKPTITITDNNNIQRPPTLAECHIIIKYLQRTGDDKEDELNQLKTDLRDVIYSHKWTPDAFLLAKAYVNDSDEKRILKQTKKLLVTESSRRKPLISNIVRRPDVSYITKDAIALPALKHTLGNKAVERKRRTQILQKARLRRDIYQ